MNLSFNEWRREIERLTTANYPRYNLSLDDPSFLVAYTQRRSPEWAFSYLVVMNSGAFWGGFAIV